MSSAPARLGIALLFLGPSVLCGCRSNRGSYATAGSPDATASAPPSAQSKPAAHPTTPGNATSQPDPAQVADAKTTDVHKQARERDRKLRRARRSLEVAGLNLAKTKIAVEIGQLKHNEALTQAERDFNLAQRRLQTFVRHEVPNRLARAELSLRQIEDGVQEAQEELYQLELMYNDEQFADQTKEIVIERAKRRLARAERDLELRREELQRLKEITLPLEQTELEHAADQKRLAWLNVQRDNESALLDRQVAVLNAEQEVARLEDEIADITEEIAQSSATARYGDSK